MAGTATSISGRVLSILVRKAAVPVEAEEEPTGLLPQVLIACTCLQIALLFLVMHRHNCATCPKKNAATKLQAGAARTVARLESAAAARLPYLRPARVALGPQTSHRSPDLLGRRRKSHSS